MTTKHIVIKLGSMSADEVAKLLDMVADSAEADDAPEADAPEADDASEADDLNDAAQSGADPVFARALEFANDFNGEAFMASEMVDRGDWEAARASAAKASGMATEAGMAAFGHGGDGLLVALVVKARGMVDEALAAIAEKRAASASYLLSEAVQAATQALGLVAYRGL